MFPQTMQLVPPFGAEERIPDAAFVDTRVGDAVEVLGLLLADFCEQVVALGEEVDPIEEAPDLLNMIREAVAEGRLHSAAVLEALAIVLQALCMVPGEGLSEVFRSLVANTVADSVRDTAELRPAWRRTDTFDDITMEQVDNVEPMTLGRDDELLVYRKVGAVVHSLVTADSEEVVPWERTSAVLVHDLHDVEAPPAELASAIAAPLLVLTYVVQWMDTTQMPKLSAACVEYLNTVVVPSLLAQHAARWEDRS